MAEELKPDICVVGGGPGGIAVALGAAAEGVPVVLVEKARMGGSDLVSGSIPSKALLAAAEINEFLRRGPAMGVTGAPIQVNLGKVRDHVAAVGEAIAQQSSAERLSALGVKVVAAAGRFSDPKAVVAGDFIILARRFVIAVGSVPKMPEVPGLDGVDVMTSETGFDLGRKIAHLLVLGAGRQGFEIAQAFNRLGVDSTVIDEGPALPDDDPELAAVVVDRLRAEGVRIRTGLRIVSVGRRRGGVRFTVADPDGGEAAIDGSHLLVAARRVPNVADLNLEAGGIAHDATGIRVDRNLRTTNRRAYAIGDAIAGPAYVSRARDDARRVLRSILFRWPFPSGSAAPPVVTFTDPALATVGLSEADARAGRVPVRILRFPFVENERAGIERLPAGMVKVVAARGGRVLGAAVVGHDAGEMIALWSLAIANRLTVAALAALPAPYPTRSEIAVRIGAAFAEPGRPGDAPGLTSVWRRRIMEFLRKLG